MVDKANKNCLLKKFLNDINKIEYAKKPLNSWCNLKSDKPKSFALPIRPRHFKNFIMQREVCKQKLAAKHSSTTSSNSLEPNIFEPEVNIIVENRSIENCVSFSKVQTSTPLNPFDMEVDNIPPEINYRQILTSTRIDQQQDLTMIGYKKYIPNEFENPHVAAPPPRRKSIYDYAVDSTVNDEEQYMKLKLHINTNILEKLDSKIFQTNAERCQMILERLDQHTKIDIIDRPAAIIAPPSKQSNIQNETDEEFLAYIAPTFCAPNVINEKFHTTKRYSVTNIPSLLDETVSVELPTMFVNENGSTFFNKTSTSFELDSIRKRELLWCKHTVQKTQTTKENVKPNQNLLEETTFFIKPNFEQDFLNFFTQ